MLAAFRRVQAPVARVVTALFAITWLGLAIQPCTAMDQDPTAGPSGHADHGSDGSDGSHHCPHCPPSGEGAGHAGTALACDAVGLPAVPSKDVDTPQPDLALSIASIDHRQAFAATAPLIHRLTRPPDWRPPTASLQQRYCSYLK